MSSSTQQAALELVSDFSLEITGKDLPGLEEARDLIRHSTRVNITFLGSEDLAVRVDAARAVKAMGFVPVPHIAARRIGSDAELREFLDALRDVGAVERVFVIAGDPSKAEGPYPDALSIIRTGLLEEYGVTEVGIAGYPEGHPDIAKDVLWQHLDDKLIELDRRGLDSVILTQFGFDTAPVVDWVTAVRSRGHQTPIRIGVPGPAGVKRLLGFARRFGVGANAMIVKKYGFSLTNLMGTAGPDRFVDELAKDLAAADAAAGVGIHMYTFGGMRPTADWVRKFVASRSAA
ncbi:methylenetetrahydrofolate reductase [Microbacterium sp. B2969]|uniref:Methylenetetrahydrofolate reductase n=1 Tax=Microbacterium alkaliflavum TaxID=3248839 RepID=A0ABW7QIL4_9MICO